MISEKQKECKNLVDKINSTFNILINTRDSSASVIWFRYYLICKYINEPIKVVQIPLKKHYTTIIHLRNQSLEFTKKQQFKDISEVIEKMDVELYKEFISKYYKKRYDNVYYLGKKTKTSEVKPKKIQMPTGDAMILLRKNPKSNLWNKKISTWTYNDWQELRTY